MKILWLSILILIPFHSFSQWYEPLAWEYLTAAHQAFQNGSEVDARNLLHKSLDFSENFSDSWTLKGLFFLSDSHPVDAAAAFLQSLTLGNHQLFSEEQVRTHYLRVLHRLTRYQDIIDFQFSQFPLNRVLIHPDQSYILLDSIIRTNQRNTYPGLFSNALIAFPNDPRFWVIQDPSIFPSTLRTEQFLQLENQLFPEYFEGLKKFIIGLPSGETRFRWISHYWYLGGEFDPWVFALFVEDLVIHQDGIQNGNLDELFIDFERIELIRNFDALQKLFSLLRNTDYYDRLVQSFQNFSGVLYRDLNKDGHPQEYYTYDSGTLIEWALDMNQDTKSEISFILDNSIPRTVGIYRADGIWNIHYSDYPSIEKILYTDHSETTETTYYVYPLQLTADLFTTSFQKSTQLYENQVPLVINETIDEHVSSILERLPNETYLTISRTHNSLVLQERFGFDQSYIINHYGNNFYHDSYTVHFLKDDIILHYFDLDGDGWYEYSFIEGYRDIFYRESYLHTGQFIPDPGTFSLLSVSDELLNLLLRYQVILHHRSNQNDSKDL